MITSRREPNEGTRMSRRRERSQEVSELEAEWARRLAEAEERARASGRGDVADYLALRALNDMARNVGIEWLLSAFTAHAGEANRAGAMIALAQTDAHRFRVGHSTMVGRRLTLSAGVRALTVEAGWPRTPSDGIVRGGGLACAVVSHFGDRRAGDELLLIQDSDGAPPRWLRLDRTGARPPLADERVQSHVAKLLS